MLISELAKAFALYLAPVLSMVGPSLLSILYFSPATAIKNYPSLVVVKPSKLLMNTSSSDYDESHSVFFGLLRSCSRNSETETIRCMKRSLKPTYDITVLGNNPLPLFDPVVATPHLIAAGLVLSWLFCVLFVMFAVRAKWGDNLFNPWFLTQIDKPWVLQVCTWLGLGGLAIGIFTFGVVRIWFGKAVVDFNKSVKANGRQELIAEISSGFAMGWAGYAIQAIPLICALMKIHDTA